MKKLFLISAISLLTGTLTAFTFKVKSESEKDCFECKYGRCTKIKSDGNRCGNCAQEGSYLCWSHRY